MNFAEKLANVVSRHEELGALLLNPDLSSEDLIRLNKEFSALTPVVDAVNNYKKVSQDMADAKMMMEDGSLDKDMR